MLVDQLLLVELGGAAGQAAALRGSELEPPPGPAPNRRQGLPPQRLCVLDSGRLRALRQTLGQHRLQPPAGPAALPGGSSTAGLVPPPALGPKQPLGTQLALGIGLAQTRTPLGSGLSSRAPKLPTLRR
jgi:hypothetical protein